MDKEQKQELIANSQGPIDQDGEPVNPSFYTSAAGQISAPSPNLLCRVGDNYLESDNFDVTTAAEFLGISPRSVNTYCSSGRLIGEKSTGPGHKHWVISKESLLKFRKKARLNCGKNSGEIIGPFRIRRIAGELITERM